MCTARVYQRGKGGIQQLSTASPNSLQPVQFTIRLSLPLASVLVLMLLLMSLVFVLLLMMSRNSVALDY